MIYHVIKKDFSSVNKVNSTSIMKTFLEAEITFSNYLMMIVMGKLKCLNFSKLIS